MVLIATKQQIANGVKLWMVVRKNDRIPVLGSGLEVVATALGWTFAEVTNSKGVSRVNWQQYMFCVPTQLKHNSGRSDTLRM